MKIENIKRIPLSRPDISRVEKDLVNAVLDSPNLSLGPRLTEFESDFARYLGVNHAIAVSSGTAGLHLAIKSLGIGENDAVITTPFSFVASANCMLFERATPIFVDIEATSLNIDAEKIRKYLETECETDRVSGKIKDKTSGKFIKAILPVHVFGVPCEMEPIMNLAEEFHLYVIEDACEAIGAEYDQQKVGTIGNLGVFAFYPNKQMTTGEGGMIVTPDENLAALCRSYRNQGRDTGNGWLAHNRLGYNYRLGELSCALGIAQLSRIEEILYKRKKVAEQYCARLEEWVRIPDASSRAKRSWFAFVVCLPKAYTKNDRDAILHALAANNIECNNYFPPIHLQPLYLEKFGYQKGDFPVTESISERTVALPFFNNLQNWEIDFVVNIFQQLLVKNHFENDKPVAIENEEKEKSMLAMT
ncbi:MAG: DegT/DnrJ/EryC1/StrS family aminotransferase [bacterium]